MMRPGVQGESGAEESNTAEPKGFLASDADATTPLACIVRSRLGEERGEEGTACETGTEMLSFMHVCQFTTTTHLYTASLYVHY